MLCRGMDTTGTLWPTAPIVRVEDSPSPVYGAALLMRLGFTPLRGSNPRSSALDQALCPTGEVPAFVSVIIRPPVWHGLRTRGEDRGYPARPSLGQLPGHLGVDVHRERDRAVP